MFERAGRIGGLLARSHGYVSGNFTNHNFYFADGNGNITYMVDSSQAKAAQYRYDPFGNEISRSGPLMNDNLYRFSSKELHVNSGLYYYLYRFYDPNLQRWISRDPIGELGGINLYEFVANAPSRKVDALGLAWWRWIPIFNLISCIHKDPGEKLGDYASVPLPSCKDCKDDPTFAVAKCERSVDGQALAYLAEATATIGLDLVEDYLIAKVGLVAWPGWALLISNGVATACEIAAWSNIGKTADQYKKKYCVCPGGRNGAGLE